MRKFIGISIVALQLFGCSQVPTLRQGGSLVLQRPSTQHRIVQGGGGSPWVTITLPAPNFYTGDITQGPDGKMWLGDTGGGHNLICNIDMSGTVTEYILPSGHGAGQITTGSDGALWFTEHRAIGRFTTLGIFTDYPILKPNPLIMGITTGSDGNVWFTDPHDDSVGKITPQGVITLYKVPKPNGGRGLFGISNGPDGNIWFTTWEKGGKIGSISTSGHFRFFNIPTPNSNPEAIAPGGDGNVYFTERNAAKIGQITPSGIITEYSLPSPEITPFQIAKGYSGSSMWIIDFDPATVTVQLRQFIIQSKTFGPPIIPPFAIRGPGSLHAGPDGNMWITDSTVNTGNVLVSLTHILTTIPSSVQISGIGQTQTVQIHETQNKGGSYTAVSSDQSIATVGPVSQSNSFVVTAQGVGSCTIRVSDSIGNYIDVPVTVD
jgi:virginiamycin B lyase